MLHKNSLGLTAIWVSAAILFSACSKQDSFVSADLPNENAFKAEKNLPGPKSTIFYALTNANELVKYSSGNPLSELSSVSIKGLVSSSEKLLAIDFRPATGQLYGVINQSRLYVIN